MASEEPATLVETAGAIMQAEIQQAHETTAAVIAGASEAIDAAHEQAEAIARGAMETEIGRRVARLEQGEANWLDALDEMRRELISVREQVSALQAATAATATLVVAEALQEPDPSLSIPPASSSPPTMAETVEAVTEVVPGSLSEATPVAPVVVEAPTKRHRFL